MEKQKKLYEARFQQDFSGFKQEFDSVKIKTEIEDELIPEEVFIDCAGFVSNDIEQKAHKSTLSTKKSLRGSYKRTTMRQDPELDDDNQQILFDEIKALLKTTKGMRIQCPKCLKLLHRHSLKEHFFSVHLRKSSKFKCDICSQEFPRHNRLLLHL